jgi:Fe-S-cluster containining protein
VTAVFSLAHHADYRCRHAGACCQAGWRIPVEHASLTLIRAAVRDGRVPPAASRTESDGSTTVLALADDGACTAYEPSSRRAHGRCAVHRVLGHEALPSSCRHFPRVVVIDARGTHVTLSHYCPTAALTLFRTDVPLAIVQGPEAFPERPDYEGLDARDALPPLLRPGMLMNLAAYSAWERHAVATFAREAHTPASAIAQLANDARALESWTPSHGPLRSAVERLHVQSADKPPVAAPEPVADRWMRRFEAARRCAPADLQPPPPAGADAIARAFVMPNWDLHADPLTRYLASKAFASWVAWQARGLRAIVEWLRIVLAVVYVEAIRQCATERRPLDSTLLLEAFRQADLLLVHRASSNLLARAADEAAFDSTRQL